MAEGKKQIQGLELVVIKDSKELPVKPAGSGWSGLEAEAAFEETVLDPRQFWITGNRDDV